MFGLIMDLVGMFNQFSLSILNYRPLSGNSYMDLPVELRNPRKGLINITNKDKNMFFMVSC